jgi:hypothetical protein
MKKINLLIIEYGNKNDLDPLRKYIKKDMKLNLIEFDQIMKVKYDYKKRFLRYWMQLKRVDLRKVGEYFEWILNSFVRKNYVYNYDSVRKLNVMSLTFKQFKNIVKTHNLDGILIHREDAFLNNVMLYCRRIGLKIIILAHEHVFLHNPLADKLVKSRYFLGDLKLVGGENAKKYWLKSRGAKSNMVKITGVPRMDHYEKNHFLTKDELCNQLSIDSNKKIIFFPSSINRFNYYKYNMTKETFNKEYKPEDLDFSMPREVAGIFDMVKFKNDVFDVLYNIAKENKDIIIITKFHPDQQLIKEHCVEKEFLAMSREMENFIGIGGSPVGFNIKDLISNADIIVGNNSTTLLESILMDKSIVVANWGVTKKLQGIPIIEWGCAVEAKNKLELKKILLNLIKKVEDLKQYDVGRKKIIKYYFDQMDGMATKRVVNEIEKYFIGLSVKSNDKIKE